MTADVVRGLCQQQYVCPRRQLGEIINAVYSSLKGSRARWWQHNLKPAKPAVPIRKSVTPEFLICLEERQETKDAEAASAVDL